MDWDFYMKKLFLYILVFSFSISASTAKTSTQAPSLLKNMRLLFNKFSFSSLDVMRGIGSFIVAIGLLKLSEKALGKIFGHFFLRDKIEKPKNPLWLYFDSVKNKYSKETEKNLLKFRKRLWQEDKQLLKQFCKGMQINNPKSFIQNLIATVDGKENYLAKNHNNKRFADKNLPEKIKEFTDEWLEKIGINPNNVDLIIKEQDFEDKIGETQTIFSSHGEKWEKEELSLSKRWLTFYREHRNDKDSNSIIKNIKFLFAMESINEEDANKKINTSIYSNLLIGIPMEYIMKSSVLHELDHIKARDSYTTTILLKEASVLRKKIPFDFRAAFNRHKEYKADCLLALLHQDASKIMLKSELMTTVIQFVVKKENLEPFLSLETTDIHLTHQSRFILHADIALLYNMTIKENLQECFTEMNIKQEKFESIYNKLKNIYQSADKKWLTQKSFKIRRFLPQIMPNFLEKQFEND